MSSNQPGERLCPRCKDALVMSKASYCRRCSAEYQRERMAGQHKSGRQCENCGQHFNSSQDATRCAGCEALPHSRPCTRCGKEFWSTQGRIYLCLECRRKSRAESQGTWWHRTGRAKQREKKFNLQPGEWERRLADQENKCAICRVEFKTDDGLGRYGPCMDHDHRCCNWQATVARPVCGKCNRSIICKNCNSLLGLAGDEPDTLEAALDYLLSW